MTTSTIAQLWTTQIKSGRKTFAEVPSALKPEVRKLLIKSKREDLIIED